MLAAMFLCDGLQGTLPEPPPEETALGALLSFMSGYEGKEYRPTNMNYGLLPELRESRAHGRERAAALSERALASFQKWLSRRSEGALAR
jgi:methylenetetrahydrofolate--tRNA-(uracil-5-)-methyltransferase